MKFMILLLFLISTFLTAGTTFAYADSIPRDTSYNTAQAGAKIRKNYPNTQVALPMLPEGVGATHDLVYATLENTPYGERKLHLDLFRPKKTGKYPVLVMIHGGGWSSGSKEMEIPMAQQIASRGYVTVPVEYRLSPEAIYPAAVFDIKAAIRWLRANAGKYDIDTTRIAVEGSSAGGQLASLVGMTNGVAQFEGHEGNMSCSSRVQAVVDVDGVLDFLAPASLNTEILKPVNPSSKWLGGTFTERPMAWRDASAISWVNGKSVPVLFINSSIPRFHAGQDEMIGIMNQYKIYTEVHAFPNCPHSFWLVHPWFDQIMNYIVNFLDKTMGVGL